MKWGHKRAESLTGGLLERSASIVEFEAQRQSARQRIQERRNLRGSASTPAADAAAASGSTGAKSGRTGTPASGGSNAGDTPLPRHGLDSPIRALTSFPAVLPDDDGGGGSGSDGGGAGEDFPAVGGDHDSDQLLEFPSRSGTSSPDGARPPRPHQNDDAAGPGTSGSPIDFPGGEGEDDSGEVNDEDDPLRGLMDDSDDDTGGFGVAQPFVGSRAEGDPDDLAARRRSSVAAARAAVESVPENVKDSMFTYTDAGGVQQGPFTAAQICEWYHLNRIDGRVRLAPHHDQSWSLSSSAAPAAVPLASSPDEAGVPFSPVHRAGNLYVADVVGDLFMRERIAWGTQALLMPDEANRAMGNMLAWDFDPFLLDNDERVSLVVTSLALLGFLERFHMSARKLSAFVTKVAQCMGAHRLPYHNFIHAVDVFQSTLVMLVHPLRPRGQTSTHPHGDGNVAPDVVARCAVQCMGAEAFFEPLDVLALLLAALMHDLDHPGLNNAYQIAACTDLATRYNDQSVLENHHIAIGLSILHTDAFAVLEGLGDNDFDHVRKVLIETILATDMGRHADITAQFAKVVDRVPDNFLSMEVYTPLAQKLSHSQKLCIMRTLVHAADVCNPTKQWPVAKRWTEAIAEEFYNQGDKEAAQGMAVSAGFNRAKHVPGKSSLSFSDFVVTPLFEDLQRLVPRAAQCITNIRANRVHWKEEAKAHAKARVAAAKAQRQSRSGGGGGRAATAVVVAAPAPAPAAEDPNEGATGSVATSPVVGGGGSGSGGGGDDALPMTSGEKKKRKKKPLRGKKKKDDLSWMKRGSAAAADDGAGGE